jgi:hypothetical protein
MILKRHLLCSILLASSWCGVAQEQANPEVPHALMGQVEGERLVLNIFPEGVAPLTRKLEGTRFINVEPGCLILEAYVKLIGEKKLEIYMPLDDGFTNRTMKMMGVSSKRVVVSFEPAKAASQAGAIVAITPIEKKSREQGGAGLPSASVDLKVEGIEKVNTDSEERSQ